RRVHRALTKVARVVDAAVRRRVDLDDVEARRATPNALTGDAYPARLAVLAAMLAVQRHRQDARERRFTNAARPTQQVPMGDAPARNGPLQRRRHMRLHGDVTESFRSILAGESEHERRAL